MLQIQEVEITILTQFFHIVLKVFTGKELPGAHKLVAHFVRLERCLPQVQTEMQDRRIL